MCGHKYILLYGAHNFFNDRIFLIKKIYVCIISLKSKISNSHIINILCA